MTSWKVNDELETIFKETVTAKSKKPLPRHFLWEAAKSHETPQPRRRWLGWDSNWATPEYMWTALPIYHCSVTISSETKTPCVSTTDSDFVTDCYRTIGPQATIACLVTPFRPRDRLQRFVVTRSVNLQSRLVKYQTRFRKLPGSKLHRLAGYPVRYRFSALQSSTFK
jgi:hypothetical protein